MAWNQQQARQRIRNLIDTAPDIQVQSFSDDYFPLYEARRRDKSLSDPPISPPLFGLGHGMAVVVDTVQIYISITNYDEQLIENGVETEASHARALRFAHLYYSACDRVVEQSGAQRVDFHSARMHAVILGRSGGGITEEQIAQAFAFIRDFQAVAEQASRELANGEFSAKFRVGIDVGPCVAINNGNGLEQEPMFLGSAANHAAKLAEGAESGIFVSDRVRALLGLPEGGLFGTPQMLDEAVVGNAMLKYQDTLSSIREQTGTIRTADKIIEDWRAQIKSKSVPNPTNPNFLFHHKEPPLSDIKYSDLSPSKSIRIELVSLFADLSGFTAYVDAAISNNDISDAVCALYVIRQELQNVVEEDFDGRKVRFIGDCIHAIIAEGTKTETDDVKSVEKSIACAGGLFRSFKICREELTGTESLGLAVGIEYGATPVSRIGIRGERSVRIASSKATAVSEKMQSDCENNGLKVGPNALTIMPPMLYDLIEEDGYTSSIDYDDVVVTMSSQAPAHPAPAVARAHTGADRPRAHFKKA